MVGGNLLPYYTTEWEEENQENYQIFGNKSMATRKSAALLVSGQMTIVVEFIGP